MREYSKSDVVEAVRVLSASSRLYRFNRASGVIEAQDEDNPGYHSRYYREVEAALCSMFVACGTESEGFRADAAESLGYGGMMQRIREAGPGLMKTQLEALESVLEQAEIDDFHLAADREDGPADGRRAGGGWSDPHAEKSPDEMGRLLRAADLLLVAEERPEEGVPEDYADAFPLAVSFFLANRFEAAALNERREDFTHLFNRTAEGAVPNAKFWNSSRITMRATPAAFGAVRCAISY